MKKVLAIVGPTASGKTKISIEIAKRLNGEIVSADSRQIYKYIPIASSHPTEDDLRKIKHYFINELELTEDFNAGEFGKKGREIIDEIFSREKQPIIAGGSGLYIRSLIDGFFEEEINYIKSKEKRKELFEKLNANGKDSLYEELKSVDKKSAEKMTPENVRRVIRALEVYYVSGKRISELQNENVKAGFDTVQIGFMFERKELYERINSRVDEMISNGLTDEVLNLKKKGFNYRTHNSLNTVGIKEVFKHLEGEFDYDTMVELIKQNTRRYAKRQMTWFNKDKRINWIKVKHGDNTEVLADSAVKLFLSN